MKRLTQTSNSGGVAFTFDLDITCEPSEAKKILNLATKLKNYEDLEEQGRLIKLPCKVGDKVYYARGKFVLEYEVTGFSIDITGVWLIHGEYHVDKNNKTYGYNFDVDEIGKTVFLSRFEAEEELMDAQDDRH